MKTDCTACKLAILIVALATWGIAFWAGTQQFETSTESVDGNDQENPAIQIALNWEGDPSTASDNQNAATRALEMIRYLNACETPEHFQDAIEFIESRTDKSEKNRYLAEAFAAWLRRDPQAALASVRRVESLRHNSGRVAESFYNWASTQPTAAAELLARALDGSQNDPAAKPIFLDGIDPPVFLLSTVAGLAEVDPLLTANTLSQTVDSHVRSDTFEVLYQSWHHTAPTDSLNWAANIPDETTRQLALSIAATKAGQVDATEPGLEWAMNLHNQEDRQIALSALTGQWSQRRSADAFQWTRQLEDEQLKLTLMPQVLENYARIDPGAAADWLNQYEASPEMDASIAAYAQAIQHANPEAALGSAEAITDPALREKVIQQIKK